MDGMNIFLNASEMIQDDQESVQIDTYCNPAILWTQDRGGDLANGVLQMSWRVFEILETNWDWRFLALLST
jgi:hypothetical protein